MKYNTFRVLENAVLETLESRQMMSTAPLGSVTLDKGVVTLTGNAQLPTTMTVEYAPDGNLQAHAGSAWKEYSFSQVKDIVIKGGAGSDYIYIDPNIDINASISSGNGNDTVRSGGGNDTIVTGNGNDLVYGKGGQNVITVGNGNDTVYSGQANSGDIVHAGNGNDYIMGGGGSNLMTAGSGDDTLIGGGGNDTIIAGNGDDLLRGSLGNDSITAGTGVDILEGDTGNDTLSGGGAGSTLNAGLGDNVVHFPPATGTPAPTKPTTPTVTPPPAVAPTKPTSGSGTTTTKTSGNTGSTTTPTSPTTPTAPSTPQTNANAPQPKPVLQVLDGTRETGLVVNANGLNSVLNSGTVLTSKFQWNFGDPNGTDNSLQGFSVAHVYDTPGTYTITLTVTNQAGGVASATQQVTISASTRQMIYLDPNNGNDSNDGSESSPIQSLNQAMNMIGNNTELLLKAGQTYTVPATLHISQTNLVIGRYGSGADPVLSRVSGGGVSTINVFSGSNGVTIQNITFDSPYGVGANDVANKTGVSGIYIGGTNVAVRDCTFLNVDDAINENGNPTGVLVEDNTAPLTTGIRGYFDWVQGQEQTIVGNVVANSTREHIVRMVDWTNVSIENNNFTNLNRQNVDTNDYSKGCIEMHVGSYGYVVNNDVTDGDIRTGPLGLWGEPATDTTSWCLIEDNNLTDTFVLEEAGSQHTMISNNVFNETTGGTAITIAGENSLNMESSDITITNNTAISTGTSGDFLSVSGPATAITLTNNLWIAPKITLGQNGAAAVSDANSDLSDYTQIGNNVWPASSDLASQVGSSFLTTAQWNSLPQVKTDLFEAVTLDNSYEVSLGSLTAGANVPLAA